MDAAAQQETLSVKDKRKFFEQEIAHQSTQEPRNKAGQRKFSFLSDHEVAKMKEHETRKMSLMSQDELLKSMTENDKSDTLFDTMIKSFAGNGSKTAEQTNVSSNTEKPNRDGENGNGNVETTSQQIVELELENGQ